MDIPTSSISNEIEKSIREEFSVSQAAIEEIRKRREKGQKPESISNEEIRKGDPILNTYKVLDDAIHGGMGSVWRVHHESWNVDLAMKRPQPRFFAEGSEKRKEEFIAECENWIDLGLHANIVSCYYVREIGGVPTIFSEWMDNGSLKDRIRDGSLYEGTEQKVQKRILDIAIQSARGLAYSHKSGLVHQDMKPGNLLLTKKWEAKVADFGLAKAQSQLTENEKSVSSGYTIQYCPREQAEGAPAEKWMDVYAWALTVLEMYAGKRLWETGANAETHCEGYFDQCRIPLFPAMRDTLRKAINREITDFDALLPDLTGIWQDQFDSDYSRPALRAAGDTADSLNNRALSFLDLGMKEKAAKCWENALRQDSTHVPSVYNQGLFQWREGNTTAQEVLRRVRMAAQTQPLPFTNLQKQIRTEQTGLKPVLIEKNKQRGGFFITPDNARIWSVFDSVTCYDAGTFKVLSQPDTGRVGSISDLSPDGRILLYRHSHKGPAEDRRLRAINAETGEPLSVLERTEYLTVEKICFHPNHRHCLILSNGSRENATEHQYFLQEWDLFSGALVRDIDLRFKDIKQALGIDLLELTVPDDICLSPDGNTIYVLVSSGKMFIAAYDVRSGELQSRVYTCNFSLDVLCPASDGQKLYAAGEKGIGVFDIAAHRVDEYEAPLKRSSDMLLSPGGEKLYVCGQYGVTVWNTADMSMDLMSVPGGVWRLWLSRDGSRLISADYPEDGAIRLWDTKRKKCLRTFLGHKGRISRIAAAEDLSFILSSGVGDRKLLKWENGSQVYRAPWELCRMKTFEEQQALTKAVSDLKWKLLDLIHTPDRVEQAIRELEAAEKKYGRHLFLEVRRELIEKCECGVVTEVYEMSSFPVADEYSGEYSVTPYPVKSKFCVITEPDNKYFYYYSDDGRRLKKLELPYHLYSNSNHISFSRSGTSLFTAGCGIIQIWNVGKWNVMYTFKVEQERISLENGNLRIALSPEDRFLLSVWSDGHFCLWESPFSEGVGRYRKIRDWKAESDEEIRQISFTPDGNSIVLLDEADALTVMDPFNGKIIATITEEENTPVQRFCFTPDGAALYISTEEEVLIINPDSWERTGSFRPYEDDCRGDLCFSPDGKLMATWGNAGVRIWAVPGHDLLWELKDLTSQINPEEAIYDKVLAFSEDSCVLYVGTGNVMHTFVIRRELTPKQEKPDVEYLKKTAKIFGGIPSYETHRCPQCNTHRVYASSWDFSYQKVHLLCEECGWDGWEPYYLKEPEGLE